MRQSKMVLITVAAAIILVGGGVAGAEIDRAAVANTVAIRSDRGIDEAAFVPINGLDQWITIRGQDRTKPVLLVLHGGPGASQSHLIQRMAPFEKDFVVVQWDQRGAGKTSAKARGVVDPNLDYAAMVSDGLAVSEYLRGRLHRDKIILLGFSWGSMLGVGMAEARPSIFAAYVGTGQGASAQPEVDAWLYPHLLMLARSAKDTATLQAIEAVGPPPWDVAKNKALWDAAAPLRPPQLSNAEGLQAALTAPGWSVADIPYLAKGRAAYSQTKLEREIWANDFKTFGQHLTLPVVVIEGEEDRNTPAEHARAWLDRIPSKHKAFAIIPGAGHQAIMTHAQAFTQTLEAKLAVVGADITSAEGRRDGP